MPISTKDKILMAVGIVVGAAAFVGTQQASKPWGEPIIEMCSSDKFEESGLHPYEPLLGGGLNCMLTQFFHEITMDAAGFIVWVTLTTILLPGILPMFLEAGRSARGLLRFPSILFLLSVIFGIGVITPAIWLPCYIMLKGEGAVSPRRVHVSVGVSLTFLVGTICLFALHPDSYTWTWTVALFLGPPGCLFSLTLSACPTPSDSKSPAAIKQGAKATANSYLGMALICFVGWVLVVFAALNEYGTDLVALWDALWTNARVPVVFMVIDTAGYYVGLICFMVSKNPNDAAMCLLVSPLLGPGCALALAMARDELQIFEEAEVKRKEK